MTFPLVHTAGILSAAKARALGAGLGVVDLQLWVYSTEEMGSESWRRKARCWARIRWEAGLLRISKMGPEVQEAVQGRFPEIQGSKGKSIIGVATEWYLESITSNGEGQQEKRLAPGLKHSWKGGGGCPCLGQLFPNSLTPLLSLPLGTLSSRINPSFSEEKIGVQMSSTGMQFDHSNSRFAFLKLYLSHMCL